MGLSTSAVSPQRPTCPAGMLEGFSRGIDGYDWVVYVGRGSTSSAVVNQASREAVALTLRAFILTPARSACEPRGDWR